MINKYYFILMTSVFLLNGCSGSTDEAPTKMVADDKKTTNKEHFASDLKRSLDKAKGVEQMLQNDADQLQRNIDEQTKR